MHAHTHTHTHTHIHNGILLSHKKEGNFAICNNMDGLKGIMLSEISQTEKANTSWYHLYVESKKYNKLVNITKKETDSQI